MTATLTRPSEVRVQGAPVEVRELVKLYGSVRAVDGVSLEIRAGEFLALLGPSGSGKTTILMTIAGFEPPTEGEVLIDARPVTRLPPNKRDIGMVFQKYALFPHMSVADNIAFPLRMRHVPASERAERVEQALGLVRLPGYGLRMPNQLSGGQQQRVALARAIVYRPRVLLMDEPLGALDLKLRQQMQLEIKHIQQQLGTTVVYVTHDQGEALTMADRIAVLHEGVLQQLGTPEELYERPANPFVADFIGETNFLHGALAALEGPSCTVRLPDGPAVRALRPEGEAAPGTAVRVAVRPERIEIWSDGAAETGAYPGVIEEIIYAGGTLACLVRLAPAATLLARIPSGSGRPRLRTGQAVQISWRPEDARTYREA